MSKDVPVECESPTVGNVRLCLRDGERLSAEEGTAVSEGITDSYAAARECVAYTDGLYPGDVDCSNPADDVIEGVLLNGSTSSCRTRRYKQPVSISHYFFRLSALYLGTLVIRQPDD